MALQLALEGYLGALVFGFYLPDLPPEEEQGEFKLLGVGLAIRVPQTPADLDGVVGP